MKTVTSPSVRAETELRAEVESLPAERKSLSKFIEAGTSRDLSRLGTDALIQFGWPPEQDAILRTLAESRWLVVATAAFWARNGVPQHPSESARCACALYRTPFGEVLHEWVFEKGCVRVTVTVDGWLVSGQPPHP